MADATGHRDRPTAGPFNSGQIEVHGIATSYYWYHNEATGKYEVVKAMPAGKRDQVIKEFDNMLDLQSWINEDSHPCGSLG
jgi:hypothetical protein